MLTGSKRHYCGGNFRVTNQQLLRHMLTFHTGGKDRIRTSAKQSFVCKSSLANHLPTSRPSKKLWMLGRLPASPENAKACGKLSRSFLYISPKRQTEHQPRRSPKHQSKARVDTKATLEVEVLLFSLDHAQTSNQ